MKKDVDITENIASGEVDHIISVLKRFREIGYDKLYWDGYDSSIHLYKSQCKELPQITGYVYNRKTYPFSLPAED